MQIPRILDSEERDRTDLRIRTTNQLTGSVRLEAIVRTIAKRAKYVFETELNLKLVKGSENPQQNANKHRWPPRKPQPQAHPDEPAPPKKKTNEFMISYRSENSDWNGVTRLSDLGLWAETM